MVDDCKCVFCGYEPFDPDGIWSEQFHLHICTDCEAIAIRVLTTAAESGGFRLGPVRFDVRPTNIGL